MQTNLKKTVWEFDAHWLRVEACDEAGQSLSRIYFEPNEQAPLPVAPRAAKLRSGRLRGMAKRLLGALAAVRRLRPAATPRGFSPNVAEG